MEFKQEINKLWRSAYKKHQIEISSLKLALEEFGTSSEQSNTLINTNLQQIQNELSSVERSFSDFRRATNEVIANFVSNPDAQWVSNSRKIDGLEQVTENMNFSIDQITTSIESINNAIESVNSSIIELQSSANNEPNNQMQPTSMSGG